MTDVYCDHCGYEMKDEGMQKNPVRNFKFKIGSCQYKGCPEYGRTYSIGPNIPASPEEAAEYAAFRAELGKRSEVRGEAAAA